MQLLVPREEQHDRLLMSAMSTGWGDSGLSDSELETSAHLPPALELAKQWEQLTELNGRDVLRGVMAR